jgi:ribosome-associated protein YbcJ (S4-like RNA binding protein)
MMINTKVIIKTQYITLGALLKFHGFVSTGGEAKDFLLHNKIKVNDTLTSARGYKIYPGDSLYVNNQKYIILAGFDE